MTTALIRKPLVSIVVPVFNGERYVRESLDSILAQTYSPIEVLVLDDASTDQTSEVVRSYAGKVKYYRQPYNRGQFENVNDGIAMAEGKYLAVYHADDVYHPTIVEREVAFLERYPKAGAVFCLDIFIDPFGREFARVQLVPEVESGRPLDYPIILNTLLTHKNRFLRGPSSMVRASVYQDIGVYWEKEFGIASDLEMWVRIARKYPIGILEEYLFSYRYGHGNSSQRYAHLRTEPERYFMVMDLYLARGGRAIATRQALAAFEAHRDEDNLMRVVNHYILGQLKDAQSILKQVRVRQIMASNEVQRGRLFILFLLLQLLVRLSRIPFVANVFYGRWHAQGAGKKSEYRGTVHLGAC